VPEEVIGALDAGRAANGGKPSATLRWDGKDWPNPRKDSPPQTMLGAVQKAWFLDRLKQSRATWKIWGATLATLDFRTDMQNLPKGYAKPWPGVGWASFGGGDWSGCLSERAEIFDLVRDQAITGFAIVAGDRHAFWAGTPAKALPPHDFQPVGVEFVTGSISAPGLAEAAEHKFADHPLKAIYMHRPSAGARFQTAANMAALHGVAACLELERSGDVAKARALSNPEVAPHLKFLDMGGHGYAVVKVSADAIESEFVCIPRPLERDTREDGGPLRYRVAHRAKRWGEGERPVLEQRVIEGDPELAI
jgi:alkaline phosphatase D